MTTIFKERNGGLDEPMEDKIRGMMRESAKILDDKIREAITKALGTDDWDVSDLAERKRFTRMELGDLTYLSMDGELIMCYGPVKLDTVTEGDTAKLNVTRGFKVF